MKRIIILIFLTGFLSMSEASFSSFVPADIARQVAVNLILERAGPAGPYGLHRLGEVEVYKNGMDTSFYVVQLQPSGFVLVAAEDNVFPVLAYSFENDFPMHQIPDHVNAWMQKYAEEIGFHRTQMSKADANIQDAWEAYASPVFEGIRGDLRDVSPLLVSTWNQDAPYNGMCPQDPNGPGGRVYAGCVATAMAQVMYYYRHPQTGNGSSSYIHNSYGMQSANYGNTNYRWNEMLLSISTPNTAIAELLYHCGVAVKMMYSPTGSGAYSQDAASAMKNFFRYSSSTQLVNKGDYTDLAWKNLMRAQLDAGKPMYYHGYGSGGHAFNLDGYQGDDHFHFNWGWGGSFNGYYLLSDMNPGGSNFSVGQGAIINCTPVGNYPLGCSGQSVLTHPYGSFEDGSGPIAPYESNGYCSWLIAPQVNPEDSITSITLKFHQFSIEPGQDKVNVYDGSTTSDPLIGTFSGYNLPPAITSSGNALLIVFSSNDSINDQGFLASYTSTLPVYCRKEIAVLADSSGSFSDGSGQKNYADRTICHWIVQPKGATVASLQFTQFDTEPAYDFVDVYSYEATTGQGLLLGRFSGSTLPPVLFSHTGSFFLTFFTNTAITSGGWTAVYGHGAVGINEPEEGGLMVFPVPASDVLHIRWPAIADKALRVVIKDLNGRVLFEQFAAVGISELSLHIKDLASGVYFVEANSGNQMLQRKFIKH